MMNHLMIVPCFNEESRWKKDYWNDLMSLSDIRWLFVNDGSTDNTSSLLGELSANWSAEVLNLPRNVGKGEAIRAGMLWAFGQSLEGLESLGFMDADGAFHFSDIQHLILRFSDLSKSNRVDALWSSRVALAGRDIQRSASRHYIGRVVATFLSIGVDSLPYDTQSGLKLFRVSRELRESVNEPFLTRWLFEVELLTRWVRVTGQPMRIREEPLESWLDVAGSSISPRESLRIARELVQVKRLQLLRGPSVDRLR
jgi:dolichyl-phosphate beta-glucosyltransferase